MIADINEVIKLIQNNEDIWLLEVLSFCIIESPKPIFDNKPIKPTDIVTIAKVPKSSGYKSLAKTKFRRKLLTEEKSFENPNHIVPKKTFLIKLNFLLLYYSMIQA